VKKLLLAAVCVAVFTFNGVNQVQLVAVIAFSAGVFAGRFEPKNPSFSHHSYRTYQRQLNRRGRHRLPSV
jgi:hypothetical protein